MSPYRRSFLQALSMATVGIAGCNHPNRLKQSGNQTATPSDRDGSLSYEPTTPAANESEPAEQPKYRIQTPATVFAQNRRNKSQTVRVALKIGSSGNLKEVLNQTYEFTPRNSTEIGSFEQHGQYHFTVEAGEQQYSETVYISSQQLADCNRVSPAVVLERSGVSIDVWQTAIGCPPLTVTPSPNDTVGEE